MEKLIGVFPVKFRQELKKAVWEDLEEIRLRIGYPIELIYSNRVEWLQKETVVLKAQLEEMLNYISGYSLYALEEELKQGYITYEGGNRIGITGRATCESMTESSRPRITSLWDIGGLNIRIAHEKKGCAVALIPFIQKEDSVYNSIIFAAPGIGKTTYLRDLIRILSNGEANVRPLKVCVVDERSEIAACKCGIPQNDVGKRTDVLDACPKLLGMEMVLRSMSPDVIAVDELGKAEEFHMIEQMRCSGVKIIGTMHAGSIDEVCRNRMVQQAIQTGALERFVELKKKKDGRRYIRVYDGQGVFLWEKD